MKNGLLHLMSAKPESVRPMLNKAIVMGFVGQDPEIKKLQGGKKMAVFSLATSERWKDKESGERKEKTEWHRIVVFNEHLVDVVEKYVEKGSKLYIDGTLTTRKWEGDDGIDRYSTEITLKSGRHQLVLLDKKESGGNRPPDDVYEEQ